MMVRHYLSYIWNWSIVLSYLRIKINLWFAGALLCASMNY